MSAATKPGAHVWRQVRIQTVMFMRIPVAAFFTLALPVVMLLLINALFADGTVATEHGEWSTQHFYTAGLAAFAAVSATYTNFANIIPVRRERGVLKRWHGTPLPSWVYLAGMIGSAVVIAVVGVVVILVLGAVLYGLPIESAKLPGAALVLTVGIASFAALGLAVGSLIPSTSAAPPIANGTILPLAFVSNLFIPLEDPPAWLDIAGDVFPLKAFVMGFQDAFNPAVDAPAIPWGALTLMAVWGVVGVVGAVRFFRWDPSEASSGELAGNPEPAELVAS